MFKEATTTSQVTVFWDNAKFVAGDAKTLYDQSIDEKTHIRAKQRECIIDGISIIDITLDLHGPLEDQGYSLSPFLVKNVRRGNTILEIKQDEGKAPKYVIGRKGLPKFFDMRIEYIDPGTRLDNS